MKIPVELLQAVRTNRLLLFVGAGVSSHAGLPMWRELCVDLWTEFGDGGKPIEPLEILGRLAANERIIRARIRERLARRVQQERLLAQKLLWRISEQIVTTNYDTLLERVGPGMHICFSHNDHHALQSATDEDTFLSKIHGTIERIEECVIFPRDYELYSSGGLAILRLKSMIANRVILFVGFSGDDPFVRPLMGFLRKIGGKWNATAYAIKDDVHSLRHRYTGSAGSLVGTSGTPGAASGAAVRRRNTRVFFVRSRRETDRYLVPDLYRRRRRILVGVPRGVAPIHVLVLTQENFREDAVDRGAFPVEIQGLIQGIKAERRGFLEEGERLLRLPVPGHLLDLSRMLFLAIVLEKLGRTDETFDALFVILRESRDPRLTISAEENARMAAELVGESKPSWSFREAWMSGVPGLPSLVDAYEDELNQPNRRVRDPYTRWYRRGRRETPPIPIRLRSELKEVYHAHFRTETEGNSADYVYQVYDTRSGTVWAKP